MAYAWYRLQMARRPILTSSISTGCLFAAGDGLAQQAIERRGFKDHDYKRTARLTAYGGFLFGPAVTLWYTYLARLSLPTRFVPSFIPASSIWPSTIMRVCLDQVIFTPIHLTAFLSSLAFMEHIMSPHPKDNLDPTPKSITSILSERWEDGFWRAYKANLLVWPPVQVINFAFVPLHWRVMTVNCVALGWNSFLSWLNNNASERENVATDLPKNVNSRDESLI